MSPFSLGALWYRGQILSNFLFYVFLNPPLLSGVPELSSMCGKLTLQIPSHLRGCSGEAPLKHISPTPSCPSSCRCNQPYQDSVYFFFNFRYCLQLHNKRLNTNQCICWGVGDSYGLDLTWVIHVSPGIF